MQTTDVRSPGDSRCEQPETPEGWPFIPPYDPTTYKQPRPSFLSEVVTEVKIRATAAVARVLGLAAVLVIARHALLVYGGQ